MSFSGWCALRIAIIGAYLYQMEKDFKRRQIVAGVRCDSC